MRACAAHTETTTQHAWHFASILPRLLNCLLFLIVSFQDSLTLKEPVKVFKVGLSRFLLVELRVERLTGMKPTLGSSDKAEGFAIVEQSSTFRGL